MTVKMSWEMQLSTNSASLFGAPTDVWKKKFCSVSAVLRLLFIVLVLVGSYRRRTKASHGGGVLAVGCCGHQKSVCECGPSRITHHAPIISLDFKIPAVCIAIRTRVLVSGRVRLGAHFPVGFQDTLRNTSVDTNGVHLSIQLRGEGGCPVFVPSYK
eukprot:COSAG02_NODE_5492_length_4284_cov_54.255675_1_plen_157_part_00